MLVKRPNATSLEGLTQTAQTTLTFYQSEEWRVKR